MRYMLDTNMVVYTMKSQKYRNYDLAKKVEEHILKRDLCISAITFSELQYGIYKSQNIEKNRIALLKFLSSIDILSYKNECGIEYGKIRSFLEKSGTPIGPNDCLISAHALAENCILVTHNVREFRRVPNLMFEDWLDQE